MGDGLRVVGGSGDGETPPVGSLKIRLSNGAEVVQAGATRPEIVSPELPDILRFTHTDGQETVFRMSAVDFYTWTETASVVELIDNEA